MSSEEKRVVAVAIMLDGEIHTMLPPARHHHVLHAAVEPTAAGVLLSPLARGTQGFLLSDGTFADRKEAAAVAIAAGQIKGLRWPPNLYSEDLW